MAKKELARFCSDYLPGNPDVKASMDAIGDYRRFAQAMVTTGRTAGFDFTEDDVLEVLGSGAAPSQELSEAQLDAVAGGTKPQQPQQPSPPPKYLTVTLTDALISSY
jgi:hypothetical protein